MRYATLRIKIKNGYFIVPTTFVGVTEMDNIKLSHFTEGKRVQATETEFERIKHIAKMHNCHVEIEQ
jgi:hypothetical protein